MMWLALTATLALALSAPPGPPKEGTMSFPCKEAHLHLGLPNASVEKCNELLPDFHRVTLLAADTKQRLVKTIVWERNGPVRDQGLAALTHYLARTKGFDRKLDATALGQVLAHFDAAPAGFDPTTLGDSLTPLERRATVSFSPLTVTLFAVGWTPPPKKDPTTGLPPGATLVPGGPPGAFAPPPGAFAPPPGTFAPPPGAGAPPSGSPPAPGAPVTTLARAVMTAHRDPAGHRLVWTVEWRGSQGPFEAVEVPVRP